METMSCVYFVYLEFLGSTLFSELQLSDMVQHLYLLDVIKAAKKSHKANQLRPIKCLRFLMTLISTYRKPKTRFDYCSHGITKGKV